MPEFKLSEGDITKMVADIEGFVDNREGSEEQTFATIRDAVRTIEANPEGYLPEIDYTDPSIPWRSANTSRGPLGKLKAPKLSAVEKSQNHARAMAANNYR